MTEHAAEQYNSISSQWATLEDLPSEQISNNLLRSKLSELPRGLRVLDLGGGTGTYSRMAFDLGVAQDVVVVDISPDMLKIGAALEDKLRPGSPRITYHVADCSKPLDHLNIPPASFDLVMANYFFPYATTREQLAAMWRNVIHHLKPGGRFVGLLPRADLDVHLKRDPWAGISYEYLGQVDEAKKSLITFRCEPPVQVDQFMLPQEDYQQIPLEVGMTDLIFVPPTESHVPQGIDDAERERYFMYLKEPVSDVCLAAKPGP